MRKLSPFLLVRVVLAYQTHLWSVPLSLQLLTIFVSPCETLFLIGLSFSEVSSSQFHRKFLICKSKAEEFSSLPSVLRENFDQSLQCAMDFASVKVASSYFMPYPYKNLHKSAFLDALALRYGWMPLKVPSLCACWSSFSVDHVLSCPKGGLPSLCHNDIRDLTASF